MKAGGGREARQRDGGRKEKIMGWEQTWEKVDGEWYRDWQATCLWAWRCVCWIDSFMSPSECVSVCVSLQRVGTVHLPPQSHVLTLAAASLLHH